MSEKGISRMTDPSERFRLFPGLSFASDPAEELGVELALQADKRLIGTRL